jgi:hypothetical protein
VFSPPEVRRRSSTVATLASRNLATKCLRFGFIVRRTETSRNKSPAHPKEASDDKQSNNKSSFYDRSACMHACICCCRKELIAFGCVVNDCV